MMSIVHNGEGWMVLKTNSDGTSSFIAGPYREHAEAVQAAETAAFRIVQGWEP